MSSSPQSIIQALLWWHEVHLLCLYGTYDGLNFVPHRRCIEDLMPNTTEREHRFYTKAIILK